MTIHSSVSDAPRNLESHRGALRTRDGWRSVDGRVGPRLAAVSGTPNRETRNEMRTFPSGSNVARMHGDRGSSPTEVGRSRSKSPTYNPPPLPPDIAALAERYREHLRREGLSAYTIKQRLFVFRCLGVDPATATVEDVGRIFDRDLAPATRANYFRNVRMIFADLNRLGWIDNDPSRRLKPPKTPRRRPRPLPTEEIERLLRMPDEVARAWTVLGYYAGLRSSEVVSVRGTDLEESDHGPMLRIIGKGRLDAVIPAHEKVVEVLAPYRGRDDVIWPIWSKSMLRRWQKAAAEVGVEGRVFHQLRHSYATRLYRATDGDLLTVAALCRHASVATTQGYAQVASDAPFAAIRKLA